MTDQIAYQEYIQRRYNAFCKTVIRCAALDKILKLKRQWERQVSLDYLMNEKFVQFAASEPDEEYPFTVCGQTVLLCNAALADAISVLPEQTREEILRYYFLRQPQRVIGACIGRSRSTAGRHIQLALQRLRRLSGKKSGAQSAGACQTRRGHHCVCKLHPERNADRLSLPVCQKDERIIANDLGDSVTLLDYTH